MTTEGTFLTLHSILPCFLLMFQIRILFQVVIEKHNIAMKTSLTIFFLSFIVMLPCMLLMLLDPLHAV